MTFSPNKTGTRVQQTRFTNDKNMRWKTTKAVPDPRNLPPPAAAYPYYRAPVSVAAGRPGSGSGI